MRWERVALVAAPAALIAFAIGSGHSSSTSSRSSPRPAEFYGVNMAYGPSASDARRMAAGGVKMARYPFDWRTVQGAKGPYQWRVLDGVVRHLAAHGITTLPILYGSPSWVSHNFAKPPIYTKRARRGWDRLLTAFVKRYGPNGGFWRADPGLPYEPIRYWQVWNEPNLPVYFAPRASPARYDRLLRISATALRNADPTAKVVIGGLPRTGNRSGQMFSWRFLSGVYKHGGEPDFDVVAIHPFWYGVKGVVHQIKRLRAVTRSHRDGRVPLWIDEVGWTSGHQKKNPFAAGPRGQARLLRRTFKWVNRHRRSMHIDRLFWVLWRDTVRAPYCAFRKAGLVSHHGQPKPAWQAYKSFAQRRG